MAERNAAARLDWVDAAKGLGIVAVAIGHVWTKGAVRDVIYAFHMPLFFLLSGYTASVKPMGDAARRLWSGMAVPYIAFLLLLVGADYAIETARGHAPLFRSAWDAARHMAIGGSELRGSLTIFWFVPCLFFARLAYNAIGLWVPDIRDGRWVLAAALALVGGIWWGQASDFSPLGLLSAPVALALLWLGAVWRMWAGRDGKAFWLALPVAAGAGWMVAAHMLPPLNMKVGDYGWPWLSLPGAVALSLLLCAAARAMPWRMWRELGRMSLVIMYVHVAVIHYLRPYFGPWVLLALALMIPVVLHWVMERFALTRRLFLGQGASGAVAAK